jgi:hypothetical protein
MDKKRLLLVIVLIFLVASVSGEIYFLTQPKTTKFSWLITNAYMTYAQEFVWTGHSQTELMSWNIVNVTGERASLHLTSHGVSVSGGNISITVNRADWVIDVSTRTIVNSSKPDYGYVNMKCPFWIQTDASIDSTVDTIYGSGIISRNETLKVLGKFRNCWVVEYNQWQTSSMTRWYDISSGICLKIQVFMHQDMEIAVTETAALTNINLDS